MPNSNAHFCVSAGRKKNETLLRFRINACVAAREYAPSFTMALTRDTAIDTLKRRGLVAGNCVMSDRCHYDPYFEAADDGTFRSWLEPIPGPDRHGSWDGLKTHGRDGIPFADHCTSMVEVRHRDGIEWRLTRVIFSQPCRPFEPVRASADEVRDRLALDMKVLDGHAWHDPAATLCVYTPVEPLSFRDFCRTFRYWLITNVTPPVAGIDKYRLRADVLPMGCAPPHTLFFDLIFCCNRSSVTLGLFSESALDAWSTLSDLSQGHISYETFACLWNAYRASLCKRSDLLAVAFLGKLRLRAALRSFAPGGSEFRRLVTEWGEL